jgi:hypothetical protein
VEHLVTKSTDEIKTQADSQNQIIKSVFISIAINKLSRNIMLAGQWQITSLKQQSHLHADKLEVAPASSDLFSRYVVSWPPSPSVSLPRLDHCKTK